MTFLGRGFSYPRVGLAMSLRHLVPVALSLCLGAALFLYWRESSQLQDSRLALRQLKRELTSSRGERDQVQFKLNLLREDVESTQRELEESERHLQELDEQLQEEQGKLVRLAGLNASALFTSSVLCLCSARVARSSA